MTRGMRVVALSCLVYDSCCLFICPHRTRRGLRLTAVTKITILVLSRLLSPVGVGTGVSSLPVCSALGLLWWEGLSPESLSRICRCTPSLASGYPVCEIPKEEILRALLCTRGYTLVYTRVYFSLLGSRYIPDKHMPRRQLFPPSFYASLPHRPPRPLVNSCIAPTTTPLLP